MERVIQPNYERLFHYLHINQDLFLSEWEKNIKLSEEDIHKDKVSFNGNQMYLLIKKALIDTVTEQELKALANKVASERVEANINIGDFVYNVSMGRSLIIKYTLMSGISKKDLQIVLEQINELFDQFTYFAVKKYTEIRNQELEAKTMIISETQKERLALLGKMSSSFVHEFRNPLTSVIGFTKLLRDEYPKLKYLDIIDIELDQLNFRITQFLHTSKLNIPGKQPEKLNISEILENIIQLTYPSIVAADVEIKMDVDQHIILEGNKDELRQVLLNLVLNSIDALTECPKPKIIKVTSKEVDNAIEITIYNNGPMIPAETIDSIFEPFYTTKELGTGIGLFVCKNIIDKHKGTIICNSDQEWTMFQIRLPKLND